MSENVYQCILGEPDHSTGNLDKSKETASELTKAGSDTPVLLELLKETLYQVALLVQGPIARPGIFVRLGRYTVMGTRGGDEITDSF